MKLSVVFLTCLLFVSCSLMAEEKLQDILKGFEISAVHKINFKVKVQKGAFKLPKFENESAFYYAGLLYESKELKIKEEKLDELQKLIKSGLVKKDFKRDKALDSQFIGNYAIVFHNYEESKFNPEVKVLLISVEEKNLISLGYSKIIITNDAYKGIIKLLVVTH